MDYTATATHNDVIGFQTISFSSEVDQVNIALEFDENLQDSKFQLFHTSLEGMGGLVTNSEGHVIGHVVDNGEFIGANVPMN